MVINLPKKIKQLREKNGFSQEYMADKLNMSRPTYMQIEKSVRELTISEAEKLASIFGMSLENFLAGKEPVKVNVIFEKSKKKKQAKKNDIRINVPQEYKEKFKTTFAYILKKVGGKPNVGMTVLYKLLYFIDFDYYEKFEEQLTGAAYIKNHYGPTPVMFAKITDEMKKNNELEVVSTKFYKKDQKKYLINPEYKPDLSVLSAKEIKHIDEELNRLSDLNATELSDLSHNDVPWITAEEGNPINYESVFYRTDKTSVRDYGENNL